jgi:hypothetical protein
MGIANKATKLQVYLDIGKIFFSSSGSFDTNFYRSLTGRKSFYEARDYKRNKKDINMIRNILKKDPEWMVARMNYHLPSLHVILRSSPHQTCE